MAHAMTTKHHLGFKRSCKGMYTNVRPRRYMCGHYRNTVANVDASDSSCRCIAKIIARDIRLVASHYIEWPLLGPGSRAAVTLSPSLGTDLLGCINRTRQQERPKERMH